MGAHTGWRCVRLTSWRRWSTVINSGSAPSNVCSKYAEHRRWQLSTITLHSPSNQRYTVSDSVVGLQPASVWIVAERCVAFTEYWLSLSSVTITPSMHMHPDTNVCLPKCLCRSVLLMCSSVLRTEVTEPVRSLVTSVLGHFGPQKRTEMTKDRTDHNHIPC